MALHYYADGCTEHVSEVVKFKINNIPSNILELKDLIVYIYIFIPVDILIYLMTHLNRCSVYG